MEGWRHIRWAGLARLTEHPAPRLRWTWRKAPERGRVKLQVVSPRGAVWELRVAGGCWLRRVEPEKTKQGTT